MMKGSFKMKAVPSALERRMADARVAEDREKAKGVESISSTGVTLVRTHDSVIERTTGCRLSVKSMSVLVCDGVNKERLLRVHSEI